MGGGGYEVTVPDLGFCRVNERDSSSWKWIVGSVSPFIRLMPMEPSSCWC